MSDLLRAGAEWLAGTLNESASQPVTYRRGTKSVVLNATIGSMDSRLSGTFGGVSISRFGLDFIVLVADLKIDNAEIVPQVNDVIDFGGDRYVVARPDESSPCSYIDEDGLTYRIHGKFA